jgi:hypothetical protein
LEITQVILRDRLGHETNEFRFGDDLTIEIHYLTKKRILKPNFWVGLRGQHGGLFGASMLFDGHSPNVLEGQGKLKCIFKRLPLVPQAYSIYGAVRGNDGATRLTEPRQLSAFRIVGRAQELGLEGNIAEALTRYSASILVPYEWRLPDGTVRRQDFPVLDWAERVADNAIMK